MTRPSSDPGVVDVDHVEFYVQDALVAAGQFVRRYGFDVIGHRSVSGDHLSVTLRQGPIVLVVTEGISDEHPASSYVHRHGDGVANIALLTADAARAFAVTTDRGARPVAHPSLQEGFVTAAIGAFGDITHTFVQRSEHQRGNGRLPGFLVGPPPMFSVTAGDAPLPQLREVDHFAVCLEAGTLEPTVDLYRQVFGFDVTFEERIAVGAQAMLSQVVQSRSRKVTFTLIEPDSSAAAGQIDDFLKDHGGPGVQHVAFRSDDVVSSVAALNARGVEFLQTPAAYYDLLGQRLSLSRYDADQLRVHGILVDEDHDGQLFQIFARSSHPRRTIFFEVIERLGARTFGSGNIRALYEAVEAERVKNQDYL